MRFIVLLFIVFISISVNAQGILQGKNIRKLLKENLLSHEFYHPFPKIEDRKGWKFANQQILQKNLEEAEELLSYKWETIPATYALLPSQTGNRVPYESVLNRKKSTRYWTWPTLG